MRSSQSSQPTNQPTHLINSLTNQPTNQPIIIPTSIDNHLTHIYLLEKPPTPNHQMPRHSPAERYALESTTTDLLAGVFFGISAALLVIALPLALCNYCRSRRRAAREGRLEI
ncbi:hypothetical protein F5Y09DRAFT_222174 [Xylaria sp. FL1042]|nr:hypothetical protein F5Y09DRAFT_222174 [Xylaria sp. FL1042]